MNINPCLAKKKSRQNDEECRVLIVALRKQMFRSDGCPVLLPSLIASILWKYFDIFYTRFECFGWKEVRVQM